MVWGGKSHRFQKLRAAHVNANGKQLYSVGLTHKIRLLLLWWFFNILIIDFRIERPLIFRLLLLKEDAMI